MIDLDGTGVYHVIAGNFPGGYQGKDTMPIPWYGLFGLNEGKWINVTDRFPRFIADPGLNDILHLAEAAESENKSLIELYKDNDLFVRYKYNRMTLQKKDAGLESALGWASSPSPSIQMLAVETLREISDPRSIAALRGLARGPNPGVRLIAQEALARLGAALDQKR